MKSFKKWVGTAVLSAFLMGMTSTSFADLRITNKCKKPADFSYFSVTDSAHCKFMAKYLTKKKIKHGETKNLPTIAGCKYNIGVSDPYEGTTCFEKDSDYHANFRDGDLGTCNCS